MVSVFCCITILATWFVSFQTTFIPTARTTVWIATVAICFINQSEIYDSHKYHLQTTSKQEMNLHEICKPILKRILRSFYDYIGVFCETELGSFNNESDNLTRTSQSFIIFTPTFVKREIVLLSCQICLLVPEKKIFQFCLLKSWEM